MKNVSRNKLLLWFLSQFRYGSATARSLRKVVLFEASWQGKERGYEAFGVKFFFEKLIDSSFSKEELLSCHQGHFLRDHNAQESS
ncbi:hypothetical protein DKX38_029873 [Salix brachista]|uniref:FBD domain-containing protein n=1 Tax=Salix brachista TaxID=2182728 RepID=A0A5N5J532_9ROSI|nr:hypothetical protein DKX38_029873 [Salix brachista]